jgi:nucleotide-binding universal stress UspA family protein
MRLAKVLCPVDRSESSRRAFEYATALARHFNARLTLLEVIDGSVLDAAADSGAIEATVRAALEEFASPARAAGMATAVIVSGGNVVAEILERAREISPDLVVIGTHGRSGFERLALGSVAEKVIRRSEFPVVTVPADAVGGTAPRFRTILCPTDFSEPSARAAELAVDLAKEMGGRVLLAHVVEWPFGETTGTDAVSELLRSLTTTAGEDLARVIAGFTGAGVAIEPVVAAGAPKREVPPLAELHSADLVVMGVSGRGAIDRAVLGSTTHHVIREAKCPVWTVP